MSKTQISSTTSLRSLQQSNHISNQLSDHEVISAKKTLSNHILSNHDSDHEVLSSSKTSFNYMHHM
jgi:hypothetical protein